MQATITYLLTEQAQRAQMAANGQPVARKQTITVEVPTEDLQYYPIDYDGAIAVDLANGTHINGHRLNVGPFGGPPNIPDLVRVAIAEDVEDKRKKRVALESELAKQIAAVERFMADPTMRTDGSSYSYIGSQRIDQGTNEYHLACPRWEELQAESKRRNAIDEAAKKAKRAEEEAAKDAKEAEKEAKEQAKLDYLGAWIAEHGSDSQKARSADNLLCRDEAITALADATFAPLASFLEGAPVGKGFTRYTNNSRPAASCTNEECAGNYGEGCETSHSVEDSVDCLCETQYAVYTRIREAMPGAVYVLRTHTAVHDCDHSDGCKSRSNYGCMVKTTVGPFVLQREYEL